MVALVSAILIGSFMASVVIAYILLNFYAPTKTEAEAERYERFNTQETARLQEEAKNLPARLQAVREMERKIEALKNGEPDSETDELIGEWRMLS